MHAEISELRLSRFTAPDTREYLLDPVTVSKKAIDSYINDREKQIAEIDAYKNSLLINFSEYLRVQHGIILTATQLENLMLRADGEDIAKAVSVVGSVGEVLQALELVLGQTDEDAAAAKKYYSLVVLQREVVVELWGSHLEKYESEWYPALDALEGKLKDQIELNKVAMLGESSQNRAEGFAANIAANEFSLDAVRQYRLILKEQEIRVDDFLQQAEADLNLSRLTLDAVNLSGEVLNLIKDSRDEYQALLEVQIPDMRVFENQELREEFGRISRSMNQ